MRRVYLDSNATTPLLPEVLAAMQPYFIDTFGNASSMHQSGQHARAAVERARDAVAALLGCTSAELVFTSGGTESDNLALFGVIDALPKLAPGEKHHIITTAIEHNAVLQSAQALSARPDIELTTLKPNAHSLIEPAALEAALRSNTRLVSIMLANNETGVINPIGKLAGIAHNTSALFHTDAVQAAGKLPINLAEDLINVDLLSISGHKMHAPQGIGALFVRKGVRLSPILHGGTHERQRRAGTENVPGIVGLGAAAAIAHTWLSSEGPANVAALRDRLEQTLLAQIPGSGVNGDTSPRTINTSNMSFDGIDAEALLIALDLQGIALSAGSACQSGATEPSHVLTALGLEWARARSTVRISLSKLTTSEDVDYAAEIIPQTITRLRGIQ